MIREKYIFLLIFLFCINNIPNQVMASEEKRIISLQQKIQIKEVNTKISVRDFFEKINYSVDWDIILQNITIKNDIVTIKIDVTNNQAIVEDRINKKILTNIELENDNGSIFISLQDLADILNKIIIIDKSKMSEIEIKEVYPDFSLSESSEVKIINVYESLIYDEKNQNLEEISRFIKNNIDIYFDKSQFDIQFQENIAGFNRLDMYYKIGDFVTEHGYSFILSHGNVVKILIYGNPSSKYIIKIPSYFIKEDEVINIAKQEIDLRKKEKIENYKILKKYDIQPYYIIIFDIFMFQGKNKIYRGAYYEYRVNESLNNITYVDNKERI